MISVIIAAHNESAVIGRCLDSLLADARPGEFAVTVVANGCSDDTAAIAARRAGVRVLDRPEPGKVGALNAGDAVAVGFPRVYLDADIVLTTAGLRALAAAVADPTRARAAMPRRAVDVTGRPLLVRAYFAIHSRLPVFREGLVGRGAIALSAAGRARFDTFPEVTADDLFLDSLFAADEKQEVTEVASVVAAPLRTVDLVRRLTRVRAGNAALRSATKGDAPNDGAPKDGAPNGGAANGGAPSDGGSNDGVRPARRMSWLHDVVVPRPWLAPAAACYVVLTAMAALRARRPAGATGWARDESSRQAAAAETR